MFRYLAASLMLLTTVCSGATPKEEAQELVDTLLPFAEQTLAKYGELYPFGAQMTSSGKVEAAAIHSEQEHPPSSELIEILHGAFAAKARAGEIRASGLAYDVRVQALGASEKSDAVAIELEHREGYNVIVYFPYTLAGGKVHLLSPFTSAGVHRVFASGS